MQSSELRNVKKLQQQLAKAGLTLTIYDLDGKEVDIDEAIASLAEAEKLAERLGINLIFKGPRIPVKKTSKESKPRKKIDGRTVYSNALKRIMKENNCTRKEAQEIFRKNKSVAQQSKVTRKKKPSKKVA